MTSGLANNLLRWPRPAKKALAMTMDAFLCLFSVWLAFCIRLDRWEGLTGAEWLAVGWAIGLALPIFYASGNYRAIFRYDGGLPLVRACALFGGAYALVFSVVGMPAVVPRSLGLLVPLLLFLSAGGARLMARTWLGAMPARRRRRKTMPHVLIYGAGAAGHQTAAALAASHEMVVRAFADDSPSLKGTTLFGLPVFQTSELEQVVRKYAITDVLLAMPSVSRSRRAEIVRMIHALHLPLHVRTLPDLTDIAQGRVQIDHVRELDIQDLLGRELVAPDEDLLTAKITGKVVLVTGAGGSIGGELCRQIVRLKPIRLVLVELSEYGLYAIHQELQNLPDALEVEVEVLPILASVRDADCMRKILQACQPDTIYHAAAYKHVPLVEDNPAEGIKNNTFGTLTMAKLALECGVKDFVLISTDKAVRPTNVMGASKRLAEMVLQALARQGAATRFSMVRFGNVLGSSGSVVPLFRRQIRAGGPVTVTHPEMTRYFMTIPEAAQLVIQASAMAAGGDVFLLDMGEPVKIMDLARRMVELSGMTVRDDSNPDGDIELAITGLRPGEKLYEELLIGNNPLPTGHARVMKGEEECAGWNALSSQLDELSLCVDREDGHGIRQVLQRLVHGYQPERVG